MKTKIVNEPLRLAMEFSCFTNRSLFVTGKAGTGKTTFLSLLREQCSKKLVVVAPTGIAAVNAGGITIHSFFQFPFEILEERFFNESFPIYNEEKRSVMRELELLIIDEVSMVRADVMDGIDRVLRHYRNTPATPFGGVQLVLVGDLFQLAPILDERSSAILSKYYASPFFYESYSVKRLRYIVIELTSVYRQADDRFIGLLSSIRENTCSDEDFRLLNERWIGNNLSPSEAVFLTTHRATAETLNNKALKGIDDILVTMEAIIEGEFSEIVDPVPRRLELKIGAHIIFTKNDASEKREYFNGKAGIIAKIGDDKLMISIASGEMIELERAVWINRGFQRNSTTGEFELVELGTFRQFPVLLAWAITIHKSQGMTFDKAVIDANEAFATGQVYVALSRLRTLDGIFLKEPLDRSAILIDSRILAFYNQIKSREPSANDLAEAKVEFQHELLIRLLRFEKCHESIESFVEKYPGLPFSKTWETVTNSLQSLASTFERQILGLLAVADQDQYRAVGVRVHQAIAYFSNLLTLEMTDPLHQFAATTTDTIKNRPVILELNRMLNLLETKKWELTTAGRVATALGDGQDTPVIVDMISRQRKGISSLSLEMKRVEPKSGKPSTQEKTLALFLKGLDINMIANKRNLSAGIIENHLTGFLKTGEIRLHQLVNPQKAERIAALSRERPDWSVHELRLALGAEVSFGEIRAVLETM
ncbi:MAG: helix-turn-helix domain-containing protein [Puia sp.]|nr:helix-turn-helix domain-containing protein [Puia sp.]